MTPNKTLLSLLFWVTPLQAQDIPQPPLNIAYGSSCNERQIYYLLTAPRRDEWVIATVNTWSVDTKPFSIAWLGFGFMKDKVIIGGTRKAPCHLLLSPSWVTPLVLYNGMGSKNLFKVPADPALKGLPLFSQALYQSPTQLVMSKGIQMSVM
tara:strand:- start:4841 stop:5296 length:456 start_codon:yes stop_codon:yes gene_type:complete